MSEKTFITFNRHEKHSSGNFLLFFLLSHIPQTCSLPSLVLFLSYLFFSLVSSSPHNKRCKPRARRRKKELKSTIHAMILRFGNNNNNITIFASFRLIVLHSNKIKNFLPDTQKLECYHLTENDSAIHWKLMLAYISSSSHILAHVRALRIILRCHFPFSALFLLLLSFSSRISAAAVFFFFSYFHKKARTKSSSSRCFVKSRIRKLLLKLAVSFSAFHTFQCFRAKNFCLFYCAILSLPLLSAHRFRRFTLPCINLFA